MKLTIEQVKTIYLKYQDSADGSKNFAEFLDRVKPAGNDGLVAIIWCGMYLGIETDGYPHT